jgi:hypothetical protein
VLPACIISVIALMMQAEPEDNNLHKCRRENLKSHLLVSVLVMPVGIKFGAFRMVDLTAEKINSSAENVLYKLEFSCSLVYV